MSTAISLGDYAKTNIREGIRQRSDNLIVVIPGQRLNLDNDDIRYCFTFLHLHEL